MTTEAPFRPREKLVEHQKYFQSIHKHTYLKGPLDKVPNFSLGFHKTNCEHVICFFQGRGIYNMSHGIGKKE
uniref:Uncharacterized protein n=1 Tax=Populus trichocarpa TaxID=3694 RepID=A9PDN8_POPTR|nr:unknown [Populus trichocarpa]